jgi:hypothetical protein
MRLFYQRFPIFQTTGKLEWSHYCELLPLDDDLERSFYLKQCEIEAWSVKELHRQVKSMLFHRIALSKDKVCIPLSIVPPGPTTLRGYLAGNVGSIAPLFLYENHLFFAPPAVLIGKSPLGSEPRFLR